MKQFTTAIFLFFIFIGCAQANRATSQDQFCGVRYCGHVETSIRYSHHKATFRHTHKSNRVVTHKPVLAKPIQVANIGNEAIGELPSKSPSLLEVAKGYLGTNPTGWRNLWCAHFIAMIAPKAAQALKAMGLNPNWARDYANLPGAKHYGKIGDLVILTRGRGGHIGILAGYSGNNPIVISGNHGHVVGKGVYSKNRVIAYVPTI